MKLPYCAHCVTTIYDTTPESWRVVCQDPGDGSGDVIVELPSELLEQLGWSLGDELSVEAGEENVCLKLKQRAGAYSCGNPDNV
ncbi:AbrB/MazE/SpoVT family DNA-binding domain-containing protein [Pseudomonas sp.]|uniref:AbrB/MazE/SpoVT family DNA-binding domain-containing protein n=1 Tax=Pseudomonas sp. TaxID=306 RepID=UPI0023539FC2|nr:AbrB/MazE/SpoVT family DNA-binding domain-containing protein [Pseudomonas sp.]